MKVEEDLVDEFADGTADGSDAGTEDEGLTNV